MNDRAMRVLIAIDGSEPAAIAIELAANVAWPPETEVVVAEAVESGAAGFFGGEWPAVGMVQSDRMQAEMHEDARRTVFEARDRLVRPGLSVDAVVLRGRPASALVDRARVMHADLVVVGSRGHGTIESMLVGSVSAEVVDHAPAPVLVARGDQVKRIVLAWDGSTCAQRAVELLRSWPIFAGAMVRVASVADIGVPWWTGFPGAGSADLMPMYVESADAMRKEHDALAGAMAADLKSAGFTAEAERRDGDAATEILAVATAFKADLIMMGTHGRTGLPRLLLGSVARNVLHHAKCSVLIVRDSLNHSSA